MAITGIDAFDLDQMLDLDLDLEVHHQDSAAPTAALSTVADALPGLGIVAAVQHAKAERAAAAGPQADGRLRKTEKPHRNHRDCRRPAHRTFRIGRWHVLQERQGQAQQRRQRVAHHARSGIGQLPNKLSIEGHTDSQPYSSLTYGNRELSSDRANAARRAMQANGIRADQVTQVRGFADQGLRKPDAPLDPANRRISLIVQYTIKNNDDEDAKPAPGDQKPEAIKPSAALEKSTDKK